ncbi:HeH/LEM domain-containing protein [Limosilactobacillus caecicola]|nr:HeH/LEM domain-containing protein [Limosilactobacillus caecicola]
MDEIKRYLDQKGVSYPANALKDDLLKLVGDN